MGGSDMTKKKQVFMLLFVVMLLAMPMTVFAAKGPYKDVTRKKVDAQSIKAISYVKSFDGWRGIVKKGKLHPNKAITRREFLIVLHNLYGDKVTATMADLRSANSKITSKFACDRMVALSKVLKYPIRWEGTKARLKRKDAARYIYIFATFNKALAPKK